jgi:hypothetical protein
MGSCAEPIAYAGRAAWCGPINARDELLCGRVVLTTVRRSLHGGPLMARADTMRAVPAARRQGHPQRQNRLLLRGSVRNGEHRGHAQHRDAWTMVWQTQVTDALGHLL